MRDDRPPRTNLKVGGSGSLVVALLIVVLVLLAALGILPGPIAWEVLGQ
ncbi:hypothetical protein [Marilutibacter chinensis]|uniref:Uncharacterized protein n=1 Tax=Marilutibacter chinensis TaxID=2912247 RepID=A0ABS9HNZ1_9GAMM|nr:hypothetical protein [Lysobacter chinensis]MCF7220343.1 hypothetical protein [Lysobacter chinensis]